MRIFPPAARFAVPVSSAMTTSPCSTMRTTSNSGGSMNTGAPSMALSYACLPVRWKAPKTVHSMSSVKQDTICS